MSVAGSKYDRRLPSSSQTAEVVTEEQTYSPCHHGDSKRTSAKPSSPKDVAVSRTRPRNNSQFAVAV